MNITTQVTNFGIKVNKVEALGEDLQKSLKEILRKLGEKLDK
jgi:hypothetical protein